MHLQFIAPAEQITLSGEVDWSKMAAPLVIYAESTLSMGIAMYFSSETIVHL